MAPIPPFHTKSSRFYHTCSTCTDARRIRGPNIVPGMGWKSHCPMCRAARAQGTC